MRSVLTFVSWNFSGLLVSWVDFGLLGNHAAPNLLLLAAFFANAIHKLWRRSSSSCRLPEAKTSAYERSVPKIIFEALFCSASSMRVCVLLSNGWYVGLAKSNNGRSIDLSLIHI